MIDGREGVWPKKLNNIINWDGYRGCSLYHGVSSNGQAVFTNSQKCVIPTFSELCNIAVNVLWKQKCKNSSQYKPNTNSIDKTMRNVTFSFRDNQGCTNLRYKMLDP